MSRARGHTGDELAGFQGFDDIPPNTGLAPGYDEYPGTEPLRADSFLDRPVYLETTDEEGAAHADPGSDQEAPTDEDEGDVEVEESFPSFYRLGYAALGGVLAGGIFPWTGRPLIYLSLSSVISVPVLLHFGFVSLTPEGEAVKNLVQEQATTERLTFWKDRVVGFVKTHLLSACVFGACFVWGYNMAMKKKRQ